MNLLSVIKRGLNRYKVIAIFLVMFFISIYAYYQEAISYYGLYTTELRSAYELCLVRSINTRFIILTLTIAGPLIVSFAFGDIYFEDLESNCIPFIFTRGKKETYHKINILAVFILSFLITFIPLMINMGLCLITYPLNGNDNMYQLPAYIINFNKDNFLNSLKIFNPIIFNILCTCIMSTVFSLFSCITYVISMVIKFNKYICCLVSYALYLGYNLLVQRIGLAEYSIFNYLDTMGEKNSLFVFMSIVLGLILIIISMYYIGIKRDE